MRSQWTRRVIPRWRSSAVSATSLDNLPLQTGKRKAGGNYSTAITDDIQRKIQDWNENPTIGVAADLLNFYHIPQVRNELTEPAVFIKKNSDHLSPQLKFITDKILGNSFYQEYGAGPAHRNEIIRLKRQLNINPRNAIALVDMARIYVITAQKKNAARAIQIAVALQPDNRFVLRSASRFYLHNDEPERALSILKKSARTQEDPWLLASMIAIETLLDKGPQYFKRARAMVEGSKFNPLHLAELGAALATLHLNSGHLKNARRLFADALENPNDNAVAQAVWAANEFSMVINIQPNWLSDRFSSEANYYTQEKVGDYTLALKAAQNWFDDEPFSIRPLLSGAFAASILAKYDVAEDMMKQALVIDPECIDSKNNMVFALACQEKIEAAITMLNEIDNFESKQDTGLNGHTFANKGMILYRIGDIPSGNKNYEHAILLFDKKKQVSSKALALAYWVQEATLAGDPDLSRIVSLAHQEIDSSDSNAAKIVLARVENQPVPKGEVGKVIFKPGITWTHDKEANILIFDKKKPFHY